MSTQNPAEGVPGDVAVLNLADMLEGLGSTMLAAHLRALVVGGAPDDTLDKAASLSRAEEIAEERLTALLQAETENTTLRTQLARTSHLLAQSEALLKDLRSALKRQQSEDRP